MAIYYINPHTITNGTGTFASPWSLNSNVRTGIAAGDEIRILGVPLTSLLTATSYTATVTSWYQLTITAGGGLGADWANGDIAYIEEYDTFFRVYSVSGNVVQAYNSNSMLPIHDWSATSVTLRRVDKATYPHATNNTSLYIGSNAAIDNVTVSDCWTDATTRVTDGSVKTLVYGLLENSLAFYPGPFTVCNNWVVNLHNTAVMCGRSTTNADITTILFARNTTYNIGQIYAWGSATTQVLVIGTSTTTNTNCTVNITNYYRTVGFGTQLFSGQGNTVNITNLLIYACDYLFGTSGSQIMSENTVNIANIYFYRRASGAFLNMNTGNGGGKFNLNYTNVIDQYETPNVPAYLISGIGGFNFTINEGVTFYYGKRASTLTSFDRRIDYRGSGVTAPYISLPVISIPSSWTIVDRDDLRGMAALNSVNTGNNLPTLFTFANQNNGERIPYWATANSNLLITFDSGLGPTEMLGIHGISRLVTVTDNNFPQVTIDATVYRTTGPSLKSYLATRDTAYWINQTVTSSKTIKIPCESGTSYTVSGYIQTNQTSYADGDCRVGIYFNDVEVVGQNMTTACEGAWESFSLTFTATETAEYIFSWKMYYAEGDKSFWLDELTIA